MAKSLFPEMEKGKTLSDLCGLKIVRVTHSIGTTTEVRHLNCEDEHGELHVIAFDQTTGVIKLVLDGEPLDEVTHHPYPIEDDEYDRKWVQP